MASNGIHHVDSVRVSSEYGRVFPPPNLSRPTTYIGLPPNAIAWALTWKPGSPVREAIGNRLQVTGRLAEQIESSKFKVHKIPKIHEILSVNSALLTVRILVSRGDFVARAYLPAQETSPGWQRHVLNAALHLCGERRRAAVSVPKGHTTT
jgi:hypothetical protein